MQHAVVFIRDLHQFRPEGGADELAVFAAVAEVLDHLRDRGSVLGYYKSAYPYEFEVGVLAGARGCTTVKISVDLIEEVERGGIALLDGEDEGEGTWQVLLVCGQRGGEGAAHT
jgi:hypothetical protein